MNIGMGYDTSDSFVDDSEQVGNCHVLLVQNCSTSFCIVLDEILGGGKSDGIAKLCVLVNLN